MTPFDLPTEIGSKPRIELRLDRYTTQTRDFEVTRDKDDLAVALVAAPQPTVKEDPKTTPNANDALDRFNRATTPNANDALDRFNRAKSKPGPSKPKPNVRRLDDSTEVDATKQPNHRTRPAETPCGKPILFE